MKRFLFLFAVVFSLCANAQSSRKTILKDVGFEYTRTVKDADTSYTAYFIFQNAKYSHISDLKLLSFRNDEEIKAFVINAEKMIAAKVEKDETWEIEGVRYKLYKTAKFSTLDADGGYIWVTDKSLQKLVNVVKRVQFGKDELLPE